MTFCVLLLFFMFLPIRVKPWQNAYTPAEAETHNESIVRQIGQYVPGFSHQANPGKYLGDGE